MRDKFKYVYHVSYMTENNLFGDCTIYRVNRINTEDEVKLVRDMISKDYCNSKKVLILNYILLNKRGK